MNLFASSNKFGSHDDIPGPAFTKDAKGTPKLSEAFTNELRESVHGLRTTKKIKRKTFGFFGLRNRINARNNGVVEPSREIPSEKAIGNPSGLERQQKGDVDDVDAQTKNNPKNQLPSSPTEKAPKKGGQKILRQIEEETLPSAQKGKKNLTVKEADELRKSFHEETMRQDDHKLKSSEPGTRLQKRPTLSKEMVDELRMSVHKRQGLRAQKQGSSGNERVPRQRPSLSKEIKEELSMSFRKRQGQKDKVESTMKRPRPTLDKNLASELQRSVANRNIKKVEKLKTLISRINRRRESKRALLLSEHDASEDPEEPPPVLPSATAGKKPRRLKSEIDHSIASFASFSSGDMEAIVESEPSNERDSPPKGHETSPSRDEVTKQNMDGTKNNRNTLDRRLSRHKRTLRGSTKDTPQLKMSFHEDSPVTDKRSTDESESESNQVYAPFAQPTEEQRACCLTERNQQSSSIFDVDVDVDEKNLGDFDMYKKEWARLIKEKRSLKKKLTASRAHSSLLSQQVDDFTAENKELRKQVNSWQEKASTLGKLQHKERLKFDNSTDLIAQARVELTKALNEISQMKAKKYDLESTVSRKSQQIEDLHYTIERQTDMIDDWNTKYRDKETELLFVEAEKRKVEDELAVLISSRDGDDIGETLRELEKEREQWLWQREQALGEKRKELERDFDQMIEREKQRHRQEMEKLSEENTKTKLLDEEHRKMQQSIEKQLKDMKEANEGLQAKLTQERLDLTSQIKKQDHSIALLEQEVLSQKKELATRERSEKEFKFRKAEVESTKDDLKDAQKQNKLLEKEIDKLKEQIETLREQSHSWREIILPGHRNMKGVTFGAENSDSLAGFLTILVEEQNKKAKKSGKGAKSDRHGDKGESKKKRRRRSKDKEREKKTSKINASEQDKKTKKRKKKEVKKKNKKKSNEKTPRTGKKWSQDADTKQRKNKSIVIDNNLSLDENLALMKGSRKKSRKKRKRRGTTAIGTEASSMVVLKRDHGNKSHIDVPKHRSRSKERIAHRGRAHPPPPMTSIILQPQ